VSLYGGTRSRAAENGRIRQARATPGPVTVRLECPRCGGDHRAEDHDLTVDNRAAFDRMGAEDLLAFRGLLVDELVSAVKGGAEAEHLRSVGVVLGAIDRRLEAR